MKTNALVTLTVLALGLPSCREAGNPAEEASAEPTLKATTPVVEGTTEQAALRAFPRFLRATGQLAGHNDAIIAADSMGRVVAAPVERGSVVEAGDVLATLDERQARLSLAEAAASVNLAESRLSLARNEQERNKPLAEQKALAESDYQKLLAEVAAREAELAAAAARQDLARKTLDDCTIRAVFNGVVAERMVDPGEYVKADSPVARVVDLATLRLVLNIPETAVGALKIGQTVEFTTPAFPERTFKGELKFLGAALREASRDLVIEAEVDNGDGTLRPGFFCDARIRLGEDEAIGVPEKAVRTEGSRRRVFVVGEGNVISERLVEVGESREGFIEVRRGVSAGESVVVDPGPGAADGLPFQPAS